MSSLRGKSGMFTHLHSQFQVANYTKKGWNLPQTSWNLAKGGVPCCPNIRKSGSQTIVYCNSNITSEKPLSNWSFSTLHVSIKKGQFSDCKMSCYPMKKGMFCHKIFLKRGENFMLQTHMCATFISDSETEWGHQDWQ